VVSPSSRSLCDALSSPPAGTETLAPLKKPLRGGRCGGRGRPAIPPRTLAFDGHVHTLTGSARASRFRELETRPMRRDPSLDLSMGRRRPKLHLDSDNALPASEYDPIAAAIEARERRRLGTLLSHRPRSFPSPAAQLSRSDVRQRLPSIRWGCAGPLARATTDASRPNADTHVSQDTSERPSLPPSVSTHGRIPRLKTLRCAAESVALVC
jgi:hypothetical protein